MDYLGGQQCDRCGCAEFSLLEINHLNGGGRDEFRTVSPAKVYNDIARGLVEDGKYNVLCKVCNIQHYISDILGISGHKVTWQSSAN